MPEENHDKLRLLVVDDEALMTTYLSNAIPRINPSWEVSAIAKDGIEALKILKQKSFDLVITDISMPEMDGLELANQIRESYPHTIVIILSGYDEFDFARKAIRYDVFDYLLKPLYDDELNEVLQRVANLLQSRKRLQQLQASLVPQVEDKFIFEPVTIVEKATAYINEHYQEPISLSDIARYLDISASYLSDIFHKSTGEPYCKYITKVRMEKAAELLRLNRQIKVYIVSKNVGYLSTKHFNVVFKKYFGMTPVEYQILHQRQ